MVGKKISLLCEKIPAALKATMDKQIKTIKMVHCKVFTAITEVVSERVWNRWFKSVVKAWTHLCPEHLKQLQMKKFWIASFRLPQLKWHPYTLTSLYSSLLSRVPHSVWRPKPPRECSCSSVCSSLSLTERLSDHWYSLIQCDWQHSSPPVLKRIFNRGWKQVINMRAVKGLFALEG